MAKINNTVAVPVFVIAFPEPERRRVIRRRLGDFGIKPRFIDAVRGTGLPESQRQPFTASGREDWFDGPMRDGAMGCSLSHFGVWKTILDEKIEAAVVLEDDAVPTRSGRNLLGERLKALYGQRERLDLVFLHQRRKQQTVRMDGSREGEPGLALKRYSDIGAESYFITSNCASYLLGRPERFLFELDLFLQHWWRHDPAIKILHHSPPLFKEEGRPSHMDYEANPLYETNTVLHRLTRRFHRVADSVQKRMRFGAYATRIQQQLSSQPLGGD